VLDNWTISRKATLRFLILALLTAFASAAGVLSLNRVISSKDAVITEDASRRLAIETMRVDREKRAKAVRSFIIAKNSAYIA